MQSSPSVWLYLKVACSAPSDSLGHVATNVAGMSCTLKVDLRSKCTQGLPSDLLRRGLSLSWEPCGFMEGSLMLACFPSCAPHSVGFQAASAPLGHAEFVERQPQGRGVPVVSPECGSH